MLSRRDLLVGSLAFVPSLALPQQTSDARIRQTLTALEHRYGGKLGVAILDTATGRLVAHRGDERFAMCSTFKLLAAGAVLRRVDAGRESLDHRIVYGKEALVPYSPITEKHTADGMGLREVCEAAVTLSDNTAGNLMLDRLGGPKGLTQELRLLGDQVTRLDRREPALNDIQPGDLRDTTTPLAMVETVRKLTLGTALSLDSRKRLNAWMLACETGDRRIRAGAPQGWQIGDKTGTGNHGEANDVAILRPPRGAPILVTAFYVGPEASEANRDAVLARVGRLASGLRP